MPAKCVIGLQWGDEAKGKLVDLLAPQHDVVVRYQGGANAGHTVVSGDQVYKLHHVPSGILHSGVMNVITPGVVIEPETLLKELAGLENRGHTPRKNMMISERAHIVMPWHMLEDQVLNRQVVQGENIGTTLRGIGPCYRDKVGRTYAMRMVDLIRGDLKQRIEQTVEAKKSWIVGMGGAELADQLDAAAIYEKATRWSEQLGHQIGDTTNYVLDAVEQGKKLLLEGAQGSLLDIDHGTYPFVTSSNSSGVGISAGSGIPGRWIEHVIGVAKAYTTRVGGGPFPTELNDATGQRIRDIGREYGTTTGRPRRCGWFDAVAVRYTVRLGGIHGLALMMMDVLGDFDEIKVCVAYELDGKRITNFPSHSDDLRRCVPVYETLPGWKQDLTGARKWSDLPLGAKKYLAFISRVAGAPIQVVSVGPDRQQTIFATPEQSAELNSL